MLAIRNPARRALAVAGGVALAAGVLAACGSGSGSGSSSNVAIVQTQTGSTADDIFPIVTGAQVTPFNQQMFQWLMWRPVLWYGGTVGNEFGLNTQVSLADAPVYSDNDTVVTLTLKHYMWSDGKPVTTRDVLFAYNLLAANKGYFGGYTPGDFPDNVKSVTALSNTQIQFTLTRSFSPQWYNTQELQGDDLFAFPQHVWDKTSASGKIGNYDETHAGAVAVFNYLVSQAHSLNTYATNPIWQVVDGPFRLKSFSTRGDVDLVPNTHYSGSPKPRISELIERPYTTPTAEFNALLANTGLTTGYIPGADKNQVSAIKALGYNVFNIPAYGTDYIVINFNSPTAGVLFRQLYIRQALQRLVNQPQDVTYAFHGQATPTYGPVPLAPPSPYVTPYERANPYPYSVSAAESLLRANGWTVNPGGTDTCAKPGTGPGECGAGIAAGKALTFRVVYASGDTGYQVMMDSFQSDAKSAGVTVQLSEGEFNQITGITGVCSMGQSACNWDGVMYGGTTWSVYPTGNGMFNTDANGQGNYSSPTADTLINNTETEPGTGPYDQYVNYISQQLPMIWVPWEQTEDNFVVKSDLKGYTADEDNPFNDTFPEDWYFSS